MPDALIAARPRSLAVVDDDRGALTALSFLLELDGYKVRSFASGPEFLEAAQEEWPDCLVLDQNMPAMTGLEVVEKLRQTGRSLPIIMVTATPSANLTFKARKAGVDRLVEKPIFGGELGEAIETCLEGVDRA